MHLKKTATDGRSEELLSGIRVLDMTNPMGMYATKVLGLMGADVIKVEPPGGDPSRDDGPFFGGAPGCDRSLTWFYLNTNKRGITLDVSTVSGRELFEKLVSRADLLVDTSSPGYLDSIGLGWDHLSSLNSGLIQVSITPFGQAGPYADFRATDLIGQAMGGLIYPTGWQDTPPLQWPGNQAYYLASIHALSGALIALLDRDATGRGQFVDVSMQQAIPFAIQNIGVAMYYGAKEVVRRHGSNPRGGPYPTEPGCGIFECKDGYVYVSFQDRSWKDLLAWMNEHGMAGDLLNERWADRKERSKYHEHIDRNVSAFVRRFTRRELVARAQQLRMWFLPLNGMADLAQDEHLKAVGFFSPVMVPEWGKEVAVPGAPWRELGQGAPRVGKAPRPGEHNTDIYSKELGLSGSELTSLAAGGVI